MRHLLIALVIALLPLRAWVGDAMAMNLQMPSPSAMAATLASADAPCPDHHASDASTPSMDHQHTSCEVCHGPAMPMALQVVLVPPAVHGVIATPSERFTSSEPRPGIKPPIS